MQKISKLFIMIFALGVFLMCILVFNVFSAPKFTIGVGAPFTGDSATYGEWMKEGVEIALKEINSEGEIELAAIYMDDGGVPTEGALVANKFVQNDDIIAVVGHLNSSVSIAAAPIYNEHNMVMISSCSTAGHLTKLGYENVFRTVATDTIVYTQVADYVIDVLNSTKAAIFYENSDWGIGSLQAFVSQFESRGGEISGSESFVPGVDKDFGPLVTKLKSTNAEVFILMANYIEAGLVTRLARNLNWDIQIVGASGLSSAAYLETATPQAAESAIVFTFFVADYPDPDTQRFVKNYRENYKKEPVDVQPQTYDAVMVLAEAIKKGGNTREKLLEILPNTQFKGASGLIKFDEFGDVPEKSIMKTVIKNGEFEPLL